MTSQKVDCGIRGDPGQPVSRFVQISDLLLALQCFDKRFLSQILRVIDVVDDAEDLQENAPEIFLNEFRLKLASFVLR